MDFSRCRLFCGLCFVYLRCVFVFCLFCFCVVTLFLFCVYVLLLPCDCSAAGPLGRPQQHSSAPLAYTIVYILHYTTHSIQTVNISRFCFRTAVSTGTRDRTQKTKTKQQTKTSKTTSKTKNNATSQTHKTKHINKTKTQPHKHRTQNKPCATRKVNNSHVLRSPCELLTFRDALCFRLVVLSLVFLVLFVLRRN